MEGGGGTALGGSTILSPQAMNSAPEKGLLGMGKKTQATGHVFMAPRFKSPPPSSKNPTFTRPGGNPSGGQPDANTTELCCLGQFVVYCAVPGYSLFQTRSSLKIYLHTLYIHPPSTFP